LNSPQGLMCSGILKQNKIKKGNLFEVYDKVQ